MALPPPHYHHQTRMHALKIQNRQIILYRSNKMSLTLQCRLSAGCCPCCHGNMLSLFAGGGSLATETHVSCCMIPTGSELQVKITLYYNFIYYLHTSLAAYTPSQPLEGRLPLFDSIGPPYPISGQGPGLSVWENSIVLKQIWKMFKEQRKIVLFLQISIHTCNI